MSPRINLLASSEQYRNVYGTNPDTHFAVFNHHNAQGQHVLRLRVLTAHAANYCRRKVQDWTVCR